MEKLSNALCGIAGEYFVAAELSRRGYIASINLKNTKGIDIVVSNADASRQAGIQVKTRQGNHSSWILDRKAEQFAGDRLFYVFVCLKRVNERPDFYVVPSKVVADYVSAKHGEFLRTPGRHGRPHRDTSIRGFKDKKQSYLEQWEFLEL